MLGPQSPHLGEQNAPVMPVGLDGGDPGDGLPTLQSEPALNCSFPGVCAQLCPQNPSAQGALNLCGVGVSMGQGTPQSRSRVGGARRHWPRRQSTGDT